VASALVWLARQQSRKDDLWSLTGPYGDGGTQEDRLAATAMALQGAGNTPSSGPHRDVVARAWRGLLAKQNPNGTFDVGDLPFIHRCHAHAMATIALCEIYGMTRDEKFPTRPADLWRV
jgi:hypothetical protein